MPADEELAPSLDLLLEAHSRSGAFLDQGVLATPAIDAAHHRTARHTIGPYKLLQQIGEGGMGVVYMAEQTEPVRRQVALKIIKPGMDSKQVIARFEAEQQALALMDHPEHRQGDRRRHDRQLDGRTSSWNWLRACRSPSTATSTS